MKSCIFVATLLINVHLGTAWNSQYAVDCPERCDSNECKSTVRCKRTVLDDCGCCRVCAAAAGETCYRTVSGMDGVKCGPGLKCHFFTEEDDFGDEFGICQGNHNPVIRLSPYFTRMQKIILNTFGISFETRMRFRYQTPSPDAAELNEFFNSLGQHL